MGDLIPGETLIYESADGVTYARVTGTDQRWAVGWSLEAQQRREDMIENALWHDIRRAALTQPALQEALERAKMIYYLSRK